MTFVAAPAATPPIAVADGIAGDGFFPALSIAKFRDAQRIGTLVTDGRVREALVGAVLSAAIPLVGWQAEQLLAGRAVLDACPVAGLPAAIGGEPVAHVLWRRAVYAFAAADLADTHNDVSATEPGRDRNEARAAAADELRRTATLALRDLLGRGRAKVALV